MNEIAPMEQFSDTPVQAACARAPVGLLAELTHRCPLQCPYCSNPLELERVNTELTTAEWQDVMRQAGALGILQIHLSGGEPTVRKDLEDIVEVAAKAGLYTNLITAGVTLTRDRLKKLKELGLDHVQLSIQDVDEANAERISAYKDGLAKKRQLGMWVREFDMPLTINAPIHRHNIENLPNIINFAVEMGAGRIEVANIQYYAWALKNRASLMPTRAQVLKSAEIVEEAKERLKGIIGVRLRRSGLLRKDAEAVHGRLGPRYHERNAARPRAAVPRCRVNPWPRVRQRQRETPRRHLAQRTGFPEISRHELDEGALPQLPACRNRFWRLPLPGDGLYRRCGEYRSCVQFLAPPCGLCRRRRAGECRCDATCICLSPHERSQAGAGEVRRPAKLQSSSAMQYSPFRGGAAFCSRANHKKNVFLRELSYDCERFNDVARAKWEGN